RRGAIRTGITGVVEIHREIHGRSRIRRQYPVDGDGEPLHAIHAGVHDAERILLIVPALGEQGLARDGGVDVHRYGLVARARAALKVPSGERGWEVALV